MPAPSRTVLQNWRKNNPEKARCHVAVQTALENGTLKKKPCEKCGNLKTAAHHEDYSKPLEVVWLCPKCHKYRHQELSQRPQVNSKEHKEQSRRYFQERHKKLYVPKQRQRKANSLLPKAQELLNQGLSYQQIANQLGISKGTAYKWLNDVSYN